MTNETRETYIKREGEWYIVYYADTNEEAGRFKTSAEARAAFPEAVAGEPKEGEGQAVPIAGTDDEPYRWKPPTKTEPGRWEVREEAYGQERWRPMTREEFGQAAWELGIPGPLSPAELDRYFAEGPFGPGAAAPTGAGPAAAPSLGKLTDQDRLALEEYRHLYDMTQSEYVAGKIAVALGEAGSILEHFLYLKSLELRQALNEGRITDEEYNEGVGLGLTLDQITRAKEIGVPLAEYRYAINAGLSEGEIADAVQLWGYSLGDYLWARQEGVSHAEVRQARVTETPLAQIVAEARLGGAEERALADFSEEWEKLAKGFDEEILASPGFSEWLGRRAEEEWEGYRERRMEYERRRVERELGLAEEPLREIPAGATPVISPGPEQIYWEPGRDGQPGRYGTVVPEEEELPVPEMPSAAQLILEAGRSGVVGIRRELTQEERLAHPARATITPVGATMGAGLTRRGGPIQLPYYGGRPGTRYGTEAQILREMPTTDYTPFGERYAALRMGQEFLRGAVRPGRTPGGAERIEETRARFAQQHPELAEEERRRKEEEEPRVRLPVSRRRPAGPSVPTSREMGVRL